MTTIDEIPLEVIRLIAAEDRAVYWRLVVAYPRFARSLILWDRLDYAERFGHDCRVIHAPHRGYCIYWTLNGRGYRVDGPAYDYAGGRRVWLINDNRHRVGGPAVITPRGCWCWRGQYVSEEEYRELEAKWLQANPR